MVGAVGTRTESGRLLYRCDGVDPDDVIHVARPVARQKGLTSHRDFSYMGNIAPQGSVIKSTAIDASVVDPDGVYRKTGPARVFTSEPRRDWARPSRGGPTGRFRREISSC